MPRQWNADRVWFLFDALTKVRFWGPAPHPRDEQVDTGLGSKDVTVERSNECISL